MNINRHSIFPLASRVGRRLAAGFSGFTFRRNKPEAKEEMESNEFWLSEQMTDYSDGGGSASAGEPAYAAYGEVSPLTEAEIYVIFGRKRDAEAVLRSALVAGRLDSQEIDRFWQQMASERQAS